MSVTANQTNLEQDKISLKGVTVPLIIISLIIFLLVTFFASLDYWRQKQVVSQAEQTVRDFVANNHGRVEQLYTNTFNKCAEELALQPVNQRNNFHCLAAEQTFNQLDKAAVPNFSATAYLRTHDHDVEFLQASGEYFPSQSLDRMYGLSPQQADLEAYLFRKQNIRRWNNFVSYMQQRQVILPIKQDQQVIGYLFLGIIEK